MIDLITVPFPNYQIITWIMTTRCADDEIAKRRDRIFGLTSTNRLAKYRFSRWPSLRHALAPLGSNFHGRKRLFCSTVDTFLNGVKHFIFSTWPLPFWPHCAVTRRQRTNKLFNDDRVTVLRFYRRITRKKKWDLKKKKKQFPTKTRRLWISVSSCATFTNLIEV